MCGIAGILTDDPTLDVEGALSRMRIALRHRGPDGQGSVVLDTTCGKRIGLAHTRLAILDLTDAGRQPMCDEETDSWIVYNGEVYNHQELRAGLDKRPFRSRTDTETLLRSWTSRGRATLDDLRGMFAFAVFDARRQQLTLARDRLGIKPLYVARHRKTTWLFASELRAILAAQLTDPCIDRDALRCYLAYGSVIAPNTLIQGVESLLPAETWTFDLEKSRWFEEPRRERYWTPARQVACCGQRGHDSAQPTLRGELLESIRLRTLSDVPVGVFLSGGIDSSAIVASLVHQGYCPRTYSVTFAEHDFDESRHSRLLARRFQTEHAELRIGPSDVLCGMDDALAAYDQPSVDGLNTYFISRCVREAGIKVALSGLGGDELFAGYPSFRTIARLHSAAGRAAAHLAAFALRRFQPMHVHTAKLRALLEARGHLARYSVCRQVTPSQCIDDLLDETHCGDDSFLPATLAAMLRSEVESLDAINAQSCLELAVYMANTLLRDTDQMSMAHALEVRVPLLDHKLVEQVVGLPGWNKLGKRPKQLLLRALPSPLPDAVWRRRKMGFTFPWDRWLRGELRETTASRLYDRAIWQKIGLRPTTVEQRWKAFLANRPDVRSSDILCLLHLAEWCERHAVAPRSRCTTEVPHLVHAG